MLSLDRESIEINNIPRKESTNMYLIEKLLMDALPGE